MSDAPQELDGRSRPDWLEIAALWGLAAVQPILDLFGRNPEFFLASGTGRGEEIAFALFVTVVPPLVLIGIEQIAHRLSPRAGAAVHLAFVALLAALLGLNIARQLDVTGTVAAFACGLLTAAAVLVGRRVENIRLVLHYLALSPLAFFALFVLTSSSGRLIWSDQAEAVEGVSVAGDGPVVVIVFDELPLASLLQADGTLNRERFPNFGRLADASTWYRNATSHSSSTPGSVPSILSGDLPERGLLPTSTDHPINVFTTLGGSYDVHAYEGVTELCPTSICPAESADGGVRAFADDVGGTLVDASVVLGHLSLPPELRDHLPRIDQTLAGFVGGADDGSAAGSEDTRRPVDFLEELEVANTRGGPGRDLPRVIGEYDGAPRSLLVGHDAFIPHRPWTISASGAEYDEEPGAVRPENGVWPDDTTMMRRALQRHLLKLGYADEVLGQLIDRLQEAGTWDDATVVVTSDHGISFTPGAPVRAPLPENVHEIYRVPLFIKGPGGADPEVSDDNALLIDVLPTILDLVDADLPDSITFDGESLVDGVSGRDDKPVSPVRGLESVPGDFSDVLPIARRNADWLDDEPDDATVLDAGRWGDLYGVEVDDAEVEASVAGDWAIDQYANLTDIADDVSRLPLAFTGSLRLSDRPLPEQVLVVIDGRVAGLGDVDPSSGAFTGLLDEAAITPGQHELDVYLPLSRTRMAPIG